MLVELFEYISRHEDVYFVTYSQLVRWMQNPIPKEDKDALASAFGSCPTVVAEEQVCGMFVGISVLS